MLKLQTLTILLFSSFALLSCSDQHDASRWELKEFDFDWRLDWPITIVTDAVAQDCSEDCLAGTVSEALGDICYYRFYDLCHTTQIEAAIERMEASGLDYIVSPRAPFDWENNVSTPG